MALSASRGDIFSIRHLESDLRGRSVRGGVFTLSSQAAQFVLQSVSTIVLARLLTPADFGLVAMVTAISGLGQAFADLGLSEATIQRPEITHRQVSTLFWINVGIGLALTGIMCSLAPFLAWFYHDARLIRIALVVSLTFLIGGLRVQHDALLRRQMRFSSLAIRDVLAYIVAVPTAILMAWRGAGYWAIVALPLALNTTQMALSWLMVRWIPGLPSRNAHVRSLISFGGNVAASYLIFNMDRSADSVLIGWHLGAGPLGLYSRAYNLLMLPARQLGAPARGVAIPAFSRLQADPERLARYYLRTANLIMWITAPIFGFLFVAADPVIIMTLGKRWEAAAPVFQILTIFALGQLLLESTLWLFVSQGQSRRLLLLLLMISPFIIGGYAVGLPFGIKGVAASGSLLLLFIFPWILKYCFRGTRLTLKRMGRAVLWPITMCFSGVALAEGVSSFVLPHGIVAQLGIDAIIFAVGFMLPAVLPAVQIEIKALRSIFRDRDAIESPITSDVVEVARP